MLRYICRAYAEKEERSLERLFDTWKSGKMNITKETTTPGGKQDGI